MYGLNSSCTEPTLTWVQPKFAFTLHFRKSTGAYLSESFFEGGLLAIRSSRMGAYSKGGLYGGGQFEDLRYISYLLVLSSLDGV